MVCRLVRRQLLRSLSRTQSAWAQQWQSPCLARWLLATPHQGQPNLRALQYSTRVQIHRLRFPSRTIIDYVSWLAQPSPAHLHVLVRLRLTAVNIIPVDLDVCVPLLLHLIHRENGRHGTDWYTGAAIDALSRIDIQLRHFVERWAAIVLGSAPCRMDAVHGAHVHTSVSLVPIQGSAMMQATVNLLALTGSDFERCAAIPKVACLLQTDSNH